MSLWGHLICLTRRQVSLKSKVNFKRNFEERVPIVTGPTYSPTQIWGKLGGQASPPLPWQWKCWCPQQLALLERCVWPIIEDYWITILKTPYFILQSFWLLSSYSPLAFSEHMVLGWLGPGSHGAGATAQQSREMTSVETDWVKISLRAYHACPEVDPSCQLSTETSALNMWLLVHHQIAYI